LFSVDVCQTLGNLADQLINIENESTFSFIAPLSRFFSHHRKNVTLILPGIYSVGKLKTYKLLQNECHALEGNSVTDEVLTYHKLYVKETMLYSTFYQGKRDSSICSYVD